MKDGDFAAAAADFSLMVSGSQLKPHYRLQTDLPNHDADSKLGEEIELTLTIF